MTDDVDPIIDPERLAALRRTGLLDGPSEEAFNNLAQTAAKAAIAPIGLVSIVDEDRQFFRGSTDVTGIFAAEQETTLSLSLCRFAVAGKKPLLIPDAVNDPNFSTHEAVRSGLVGAYAGYPIILDDGHAVGVVCVVDQKSRDWNETQIEMLQGVADEAVRLIKERAAAADASAWRAAAKAGLTSMSDDGEAAPATGSLSLAPYVAYLERGEVPPASKSLTELGAMLAATVYFYLRQLDAYVAVLESQATPEIAQENQLRAAIVSAEAALLRALTAYDQHCTNAPSDTEEENPVDRMCRLLRDSIAEFLDAQKRRSRVSLLYRRSTVGFDDLERAVTAANDAEQAMRLSLRNFEMQRD